MEQDHLPAWSALVGAEAREFPSGDSSVLEIAGYTDQVSYDPGQRARLFVHTTAPSYDIEVLRDGLHPKPVWARASVPGIHQNTPENAYVAGCGRSDPVEIPIAED